MKIRPATPSDLADIEGCAKAAFEMYVQRIGKRPAPMVADFATLIAEGKVYVTADAKSAEGIQGYVVFYPCADVLHLENVAVFPRNKGRGLGGQLISFVEAEARRRGFVAVELYTNAKMTENLSMYPKLGYEEQGRRQEAGFDRVFFRKQIAPKP